MTEMEVFLHNQSVKCHIFYEIEPIQENTSTPYTLWTYFALRPRWGGGGDLDVEGAGMFVWELELKNVQRETKS